jgi:hypothetical protein
MSVSEIQTLAQRFADAFDKNDMKRPGDALRGR